MKCRYCKESTRLYNYLWNKGYCDPCKKLNWLAYAYHNPECYNLINLLKGEGKVSININLFIKSRDDLLKKYGGIKNGRRK